jgi:hypothetical protein
MTDQPTDNVSRPQDGAVVKPAVTRRAIHFRAGNPESIQVPVEWKEAEGIEASYRETNAALAKRNYACKCKIGSEPLVVVEGYWIWWCHTHHQPLPWCERNRPSSHGG